MPSPPDSSLKTSPYLPKRLKTRMTTYKKAIAEILSPLTGLSIETLEESVTLPQHEGHGDFSFPCFSLAKTMRRPPAAIALELAEKFVASRGIERVEALSGYLNFFVDKTSFARDTLRTIAEAGESWGRNEKGFGKSVVLDFSSPNMGKELAFHHLRGTILGNCLSRIYAACGYQVIRINHLGDWGTSYGKLIVMYQREGLTEADLPTMTIERLNALYKAFADAATSNPELEDQARKTFLELESGHAEYQRLWYAFREVTLTELRRLYRILDVEFDHYTGEAFFTSHLPNTIQRLEAANLLTRSQGADIVDLESEKLAPALIRKSDGATLYITRDIAAAIYRQEQYHFDRCLYVVDNGQSLHFKQLFAVLNKLGFTWTPACVHIPYGLVLIKSDDGGWEKGKTRAGAASLLKDVLDAAKEKILAIITEKNPEAKAPEELAMRIGVGGLIFSELKNRRLGDIRFEWEQALSFEGDSGPYVQNAHVRLCSILRKVGAELMPNPAGLEPDAYSKLSQPTEVTLIQVLAQFPERVQAACLADDPCTLAQFALEVAERTHGFIHSCRVIGSAEEAERIHLIQCARLTLHNTLRLISVPAIEHM
jgi:arginyl-tRNA synthetase